MISLEHARAHVLASSLPLTPVRLALPAALGCVLASDVTTREAVPPFANTAMDGFAVRAVDVAGASDDTPVTLHISGTLRAGQAPELEVAPGEAVRIMTGAPIPTGADAVVMVERTSVSTDGASVHISAAVEPGTHIRPAGDDLKPGQLVFRAGEVLTPGHLGVLASIGEATAHAYPPVTVGVFSTGDELVPVGHDLAPGQIRDSNRLALLASLREAGCDGVDLGAIPDDEEAIAAGIREGVRRCDALLTSGGVSMGDYDFVKVVLDRLGDMRWMQVDIKPAKPLAFGMVPVPVKNRRDVGFRAGVERVPVFGLPGNPVSSLVSFELFARPALRQMMGHPPDRLDRPRVTASATEPLARRADGKIHFVRVVCSWDPSDAGFHVRSAGRQGSHQLSAMAGANALAVLQDGDGVEVGDQVDVLLLG